MYTAYPEQSPESKEVVAIITAEDSRERLIARLLDFVHTHQAQDFCQLSPTGERTQYTHQHRAMKKKGGNAPREFSLTEDFVDLKLFIEKGQYEEALPLYFHLRKFVA